ncbi:MAG: ABC transporter permease [Fimbriimonadales bacterium]|nr:ABC transporter permease [Fimbriimonadales bacterium]
MGVIVALTLKEAMRRRAFLGTLIILVALYGLTFLPRAFKEAFGGDERQFEIGVNLAVLFGVDIIKFFSAVLAILLCSGAITAEIERGYLAAILPRPLHRWELYLGKWLGVMLFSAANATLWTAMLWISVAIQGEPRVEMWQALPYVLLYPVLYGTLALALSSFLGASIASMFTVAAGAFAYFSDHFLRPIAAFFNVKLLQQLVWLSEWVLPMATLKRLVQARVDTILPPGMGDAPPFAAEEVLRFLKPEVQTLDVAYVGVYIGVALLLGVTIFWRRDVQ